MIDFGEDGNTLLLRYEQERGDSCLWLDERLQTDGKVTLRKTFTFRKDDRYSKASDNDSLHTSITFVADSAEDDLSSEVSDDDDPVRTFILGSVEDGYNRINKDVLGLKHDLFIARSVKLTLKVFVADNNISVFQKIDELIDEVIVIGGNRENAIPEPEFYLLLKRFPTTTERKYYAHSRIERILRDYFGTISDAEAKLNAYLARRESALIPRKSIALTQSKSPTSEYIHSELKKFELHKFEYIRNELKEMLKGAESYQEKDWQKQIVKLLLFIFPKYVAVLEKVHVKDSSPGKKGRREIDLMLVDANGNIDIIEIKKPFQNALLSPGKYRDNHTPRKELAGAVMQAEKYLFHLSKWGCAGEQEIYKRRRGEFPEGIKKLKITNPKAIILLGRDDNFSDEHIFDFEIIRRQYANMLDIMTYDDLLRRVDNIITMMERQVSSGEDE